MVLDSSSVSAVIKDMRFYCDGVDVTHTSHICDNCVALSRWELTELELLPPPADWSEARKHLVSLAKDLRIHRN